MQSSWTAGFSAAFMHATRKSSFVSISNSKWPSRYCRVTCGRSISGHKTLTQLQASYYLHWHILHKFPVVYFLQRLFNFVSLVATATIKICPFISLYLTATTTPEIIEIQTKMYIICHYVGATFNMLRAVQYRGSFFVVAVLSHILSISRGFNAINYSEITPVRHNPFCRKWCRSTASAYDRRWRKETVWMDSCCHFGRLWSTLWLNYK